MAIACSGVSSTKALSGRARLDGLEVGRGQLPGEKRRAAQALEGGLEGKAVSALIPPPWARRRSRFRSLGALASTTAAASPPVGDHVLAHRQGDGHRRGHRFDALGVDLVQLLDPGQDAGQFGRQRRQARILGTRMRARPATLRTVSASMAIGRPSEGREADRSGGYPPPRRFDKRRALPHG